MVDFFIVVSFSLMVVFVFTNAVLRYVANSGITQVEELGRYLFVWISFLGAIAAYKEKRHVGISLLLDHLSGIPKTILTTAGYLVIIGTLVVVFWGSLLYVRTTAASLGPATGIPLACVSISLTIMILAIAGIVLSDMVRYYRSLFLTEEK